MNCYSIFASYFPTDFWKSCLALSQGALLWVSSDGDDQRIFLVRKFGKFFFFWGGGGFFRVFKTIWRFVATLLPRSSANRIQPIANLGSQICHGIFGGVDIWSRDFFGFWFLHPFSHSHHLKSGAPSLGLYESNKANGALCVWDERGEK